MVRKLRKYTNPANGNTGTRPNPRRFLHGRPNETFRQSNGAVSSDFKATIWKTIAATAIYYWFSASCSVCHPENEAISHECRLLDMLPSPPHLCDDDPDPLVSAVSGYHQPPRPLPSFYHHQVPSLIVHLERGYSRRRSTTSTAARPPPPIERTARGT